MSIDEILNHNKRFVQQKTLRLTKHLPRKRMAIVTCMDCRLVQMFERALGLKRGDVLELRTAGATISEPDRASAASDLVRSLANGIYLLGVREVAVIGHTECGLTNMNPTGLIDSMQKLGVDPECLIRQENLGDIQGLMRRLGAFQDVHVNVREVVNAIRNSHYLPKIPVHGLVIDINTGKLELVDRAQITSTKHGLQTCDEVCSDIDRTYQFPSVSPDVTNTPLEKLNSSSTMGD